MNKGEKIEALSVSSETLLLQIQREIDCIGCFNQLKSYILLNFTEKSPENSEENENFLEKNCDKFPAKKLDNNSLKKGFNLYENTRFGLNSFSNNTEISELLCELKINSDVFQEFNKDLSIKKPSISKNNCKIHRCLLHSKKNIANKNLYSIIESNIGDFHENVHIDEGIFLKNLNVFIDIYAILC